MASRYACLVLAVILSACIAPTPDATQWCAENPRAVAMAAGDEFTELLIDSDVGVRELLQWLEDETPTREEHAAIVDVFDRWRNDEPAAYERACREAFAPG